MRGSQQAQCGCMVHHTQGHERHGPFREEDMHLCRYSQDNLWSESRDQRRSLSHSVFGFNLRGDAN